MDILAIENLLLDRIKSQILYLESVESFDGNLAANIEELIYRSPMVLINIPKIRRHGPYETFSTLAREYTVTLGIIARSLSGPVDSMRRDSGIYNILDDLRAALVGHQLSASLSPATCEEEVMVAATRTGVCYQATYQFYDIV